MPVETEVLVEVQNTIERPIYEEIVEERHVNIDKEVVEYYDVIREKVIEQPKYVDMHVKTKKRVQKPVEHYH